MITPEFGGVDAIVVRFLLRLGVMRFSGRTGFDMNDFAPGDSCELF
jgi:hypothetical protein